MPSLFDEVPWWTTADTNNALSRERDKKLPVRSSFFNALVPQVSAKDAAINRPDPVERASMLPFATYPDGSTKLALPGMIAEDIPRAFTAPARAYRGEIPDDEMISEGLNFAGNMAMTGGIAPKPSNAAGMFGGRLAKTADHTKLKTAEDMAARGMPREDIWSQTGWFQGTDGKWRFEIDDSRMAPRNAADWTPKGKQWDSLEQSWIEPRESFQGLRNSGKSNSLAGGHGAFSHDALVAAYPDVADIRLGIQQSDGGVYSPPFNGRPERITLQDVLDIDEAKSIAAHEIQHAIQQRETFGRGAERRGWGADAEKSYWNTSGEVEARAVQNRLDLTPEQRSARPPWLDYDIPESQQIVRFGNNGPSYSLDTDIARQIHEAQRAANPAADPNRLAQIEKRGPYYEVSSPVGNVRAKDVPDGVQITSSRLDPDVPRGMGYGTPLYEILAQEAAAAGKPLASDGIVSKPAQNVYSALSRRGYDVYGPPANALRHPDSGSLIANEPIYNVSAPNVAPREMPPPLPDTLYGNGKSATAPGLLAAEAADKPRVPNPIRAYHGSPHDFDKFDLSKVGTGEGAQAFGHGLYFAENEGVAKSYRDALAGQKLSDGSMFNDASPAHQAAAYVAGTKSKEEAIAALVDDIAMSQRQHDGAHAQRLMRAKGMLERGEPIPTLNNGKMYEVSINASPDDFLDWDRPLSQQSEKVRGAASKAWGIPIEQLHDELFARKVPADISQKLRDEGVAGVRYLDQGSRTAGEGSSNYVAFDADLIEILRKYMNPQTAVAPGVLMVEGAKDGRRQ
jgi:hypothetical protein